jgi:3-oxoacyl-[acyl-carrier protein] reductase
VQIAASKVIVTGATGGIGQATVRTLLAHGCERVGLLARNADALSSLVQQLGTTWDPERIVPLVADVSDADEVSAAFAQFDQAAGGLNVLVNNAGILVEGLIFSASFKGIQRFSFDAWKRVIDTNLGGTFLCAQLAAERMIRKRQPGVIVNISSHSRMGRVAQSAYSASKGGVDALTFTLARELRGHGIRCCAVAPGLTDTPLLRDIDQGLLDKAVAEICVGRPGQPEEVAHGIRFCIENEFFNGRVLELDGGTFG